MRPKATHLCGTCSQGADDRRRDYHHGRPAGREPMPLVPGGRPGHWVRYPFGDRQAVAPHKPEGGRSASRPADCNSTPDTQEWDTDDRACQGGNATGRGLWLACRGRRPDAVKNATDERLCSCQGLGGLVPVSARVGQPWMPRGVAIRDRPRPVATAAAGF